MIKLQVKRLVRFSLSSKLMSVILPLLLSAVLVGCSPSPGGSSDAVWPAQNPPLDDALQLPMLPEPTMIEYADPDAGFVALVPLGWRRVNLYEQGDSGLSISFDSPASGIDDQFSDYLLIEILPDDPPVAFDFAPTERTTMVVAGKQVARERFELPNHKVGEARFDLVAWQIVYREPGYSVGIYAVGERREDSRLERLIIEFAYSLLIANAPFILT